MKYMGSKRHMLKNGLGHVLLTESTKATSFVDLFSGSGAVAWFIAQNRAISVQAVDLQAYAKQLAAAVICRTRKLDANRIFVAWHARSTAILSRDFKALYSEALSLERNYHLGLSRTHVETARSLSIEARNAPITAAYGGYYFSPAQALRLDSLRASLPTDSTSRNACLAALIQAASQCAAAPGHTAQPFRPKRNGLKWIHSAWTADAFNRTLENLMGICSTHAQVSGKAHVADANDFADRVPPGSLVFVDPPYSAVHYSRFYHVLETLAQGSEFSPFGEGRYPPTSLRPRSAFSVKGESRGAMQELLGKLAARATRVILTFPSNEASNGLSGDLIEAMAAQHFKISRKLVRGRFSTLGGNGDHRRARIQSSELILILRPK